MIIQIITNIQVHPMPTSSLNAQTQNQLELVALPLKPIPSLSRRGVCLYLHPIWNFITLSSIYVSLP